MRSSSRAALILLTIVVAAMMAGTTQAQKKVQFQEPNFLRIGSISDEDVFVPGAPSSVVGVLQWDIGKSSIESLLLRIRVYAPHKQGFAIATMTYGEVAKPLPGTNLYPIKGALILPEEEGTYLLKVDCLDRKLGKKYPQNLVASQSVFIEVKGSAKQKRKTYTVDMNDPKTGTKFKTMAPIGVGGTSTNEDVTQMRVRFLEDGAVVSQITVAVAGGNWKGVLMAPGSGWPLGKHIIEAQGLDAGSKEVAGERDTVEIEIVK